MWSAIDDQLFHALLCPHRGQKSRDSQYVVEMPMRKEQPPQASKAGTVAQQLTLRSLTAIYQNACIAGGNQQAWMIAVGRWNTRRGAQESQIEHCLWLSSAAVDLGLDISQIASPTNVSRPSSGNQPGRNEREHCTPECNIIWMHGSRIRC
jgi:hypothetical protein